MASADVLYEGMSGDDHSGAVVLLEPAHRTKPRLQPAVICFETVIAISVGAMPSRWQQLFQRGRVHRRKVGDDLHRHHPRSAHGVLEEPAGSPPVTLGGDEHVDDLAELIDRSVHIPPPAGDLHIGLVGPPAVANGVPAWAGGLGQQGREPLHPPVDGDVVDLDTPLGEQFLDVAVGQAEAQVPAHRQHDHIGWEAEAGEGGARRDRPAGAVSGSHIRSLTAPTALRRTQQSRQRRKAVLTLAVPRDCRVELKVVSASLMVGGLRAPVDAHTVSGEITLTGLRGPVEAESVSGPVQASGVTGDLSARTVSGDLTVAEGGGGSVRAKTVSGAVTIDLLASGDRDINLSSVSGDLTVRLPETSDLQVKLQSTSGQVSSAFEQLARDRTPGRYTAWGRLGAGTGRLRAASTSGHVALLRRASEASL